MIRSHQRPHGNLWISRMLALCLPTCSVFDLRGPLAALSVRIPEVTDYCMAARFRLVAADDSLLVIANLSSIRTLRCGASMLTQDLPRTRAAANSCFGRDSKAAKKLPMMERAIISYLLRVVYLVIELLHLLELLAEELLRVAAVLDE